MYQTIVLSTADSIATIKLNRPEKLNAFGGPMREEILDALDKIAADEHIRAVIVTGEGRASSRQHRRNRIPEHHRLRPEDYTDSPVAR